MEAVCDLIGTAKAPTDRQVRQLADREDKPTDFPRCAERHALRDPANPALMSKNLLLNRTGGTGLEGRYRVIFGENLKNYQPPRGYGTHSWRLSSNLWSKVLDTIRYTRQTLGHRYGGIWTMSPARISQTCHQCGERGVRVEHDSSTRERRGGEYFYCGRCEEHFHADVNAARNIIHVQDCQSSAVAGRT